MPRPSKPHLANGYWRCRIGGQTHHLGNVRREAFKKFHKLMAAKLGGAGGPASVAGAVDAWLKLHRGEWYDFKVKNFVAFAGRIPLADVDGELLEQFMVHFRDDVGLSAKTIRERFGMASSILRHANKKGWLDTIPDLPKLPKAVANARDVQQQKLKGVFDKLPECANRILTFILATGFRPSEACGLRCGYVSLRKGVCVLPEHKTADQTGKPRTIYLTPEATKTLKAVPGTREGFVFLSRLGKPYTPAGLRSILRRHSDQTITPYQLRHTFAQNASETLQENDLAALLGHTDPATTRIYYQIRDHRAVAAARRMKSAVNG